MKAILVIDVDKDELGEAVATITSKEKDITFFARGVIKPMPTYDWHEEGKENECEEWYKNGWNDCLEEIEK